MESQSVFFDTETCFLDATHKITEFIEEFLMLNTFKKQLEKVTIKPV
jgi:hypothetical protein